MLLTSPKIASFLNVFTLHKDAENHNNNDIIIIFLKMWLHANMRQFLSFHLPFKNFMNNLKHEIVIILGGKLWEHFYYACKMSSWRKCGNGRWLWKAQKCKKFVMTLKFPLNARLLMSYWHVYEKSHLWPCTKKMARGGDTKNFKIFHILFKLKFKIYFKN